MKWTARVKRLEPVLAPELELQYQERYFAFDARFGSAMLLVSVLAHAVFFPIDLAFIEASWLRIVLLGLRVAMACFSIWCWLHLRAKADRGTLVRTSIVWLAAFTLSTWLIDASRPPAYYWNTILYPLVALLMYYFAPLPLAERSAFALTFSGLILFNLLVLRGPLPFPGSFIVLIAYAIVHPIGILHSSSLFTLRRREFEARMTQQKQTEELERIAVTDSLTELPNRRYFLEQAQIEFDRSVRYQRPLSLILVDIDGFKQVNDQYGHLAGDEALRKFADLVQAQKRSTDLAARIGGEEFAILLPETDRVHASRLAERIRRMIATTTISWNDVAFNITISQGAIDRLIADPDFFSMLHRADSSLYKAKLLGRNQVMIGDTLPLPSSDGNKEVVRWRRRA